MDEHLVFDPYGKDVLDQPFQVYGKLRETCPVAKVVNQQPNFYIVSRYADVVEVMNNHSVWTKRNSNALKTTEPGIALNQDPPDFTEFRMIFAEYLSRKGVERWAAAMESLANELIDAMLTHSAGDLHDEFAMPLPVKVMALILGIPQDRFVEYKAWSDFFMAAAFNAPDPAELQASLGQLYGFFHEQFELRRKLLVDAGVAEAGPEHVGTVLPEGLMSLLLTARFKGRALTDDELNRTCRSFFVGGNETTTSLLLNLLTQLNAVPERWAQIRSDPSLIEAAVEESLRFDPPAFGMWRENVCPVKLHGVDIPAGSKVMFGIVGANRDPEVFSDPDEFKIDRARRERAKHVAFSYGSHFCPGAWVTRLEVRIAMRLLVERLPELRITGAGERIAPFNFWGLRSLPAAW